MNQSAHLTKRNEHASTLRHLLPPFIFAPAGAAPLRRVAELGPQNIDTPMKLPLTVIISLFAACPLFAQEPPVSESIAGVPVPDKVIHDVYPRWTIVGDWRVTNPDWTGILTIRADGTLSNSIRATGRWLLTSDAGTLLLVIRWDSFGTESLEMVTPDHFRGQKKQGRFIDMQRGGDASKPKMETK